MTTCLVLHQEPIVEPPPPEGALDFSGVVGADQGRNAPFFHMSPANMCSIVLLSTTDRSRSIFPCPYAKCQFFPVFLEVCRTSWSFGRGSSLFSSQVLPPMFPCDNQSIRQHAQHQHMRGGRNGRNGRDGRGEHR